MSLCQNGCRLSILHESQAYEDVSIYSALAAQSRLALSHGHAILILPTDASVVRLDFPCGRQSEGNYSKALRDILSVSHVVS